MFKCHNVDHRNAAISKHNQETEALASQGKIPVTATGLSTKKTMSISNLDPIARKVALSNPGCFVIRRK